MRVWKNPDYWPEDVPGESDGYEHRQRAYYDELHRRYAKDSPPGTHAMHPEDWRVSSADSNTTAEYVGPTKGWQKYVPWSEQVAVSGVYLLQGETTKKVKVGSSRNVYERIRQLQIGSAEQLILVDVLDLEPGSESVFKTQHSDIRIRGEWYEPEILDRLAEYPRA